MSGEYKKNKTDIFIKFFHFILTSFCLLSDLPVSLLHIKNIYEGTLTPYIQKTASTINQNVSEIDSLDRLK